MDHIYQGSLIHEATISAVKSVIKDYEVMTLTILDAILDRYERNPEYHFIDTKLSIITGDDLLEAKDSEKDFKGKTAIFGWIQGRGLESLAGHIEWLPHCSLLTPNEIHERSNRLIRITEEVFDQMEAIRAVNDGGLSFLMTPEGTPFTMDDQGRRQSIKLDPQNTSTTDMFYAKGMMAAALLLGKSDKVDEAKDYFRTVVMKIEKGRLAGDQVSFDPKNPTRSVTGKRDHGGYMISILGCANLAKYLGEEEWYACGERLIRHVIDHHINQSQFKNLELFDFVESIDPEGNPWEQEGHVLSDPGHSLELIGIATKFLLVLRDRKEKTASQEKLLEQCVELFPKVLIKNFRNGFNRNTGGLCKVYDLISRKPLNSDMPWWNLPETMRAAAELLLLNPDDEYTEEMLQILMHCSNAFIKNYVNRDVYLMAYQTIDKNGQPVDTIPATADADPGYHTGLSVIDFLDCLRKINTPSQKQES